MCKKHLKRAWIVSVSMRPTGLHRWVPGQLELHNQTLSKKKRKSLRGNKYPHGLKLLLVYTRPCTQSHYHRKHRKKNSFLSQVWWFTLIISAPWKPGQEDCFSFMTSLNCNVSSVTTKKLLIFTLCKMFIMKRNYIGVFWYNNIK